MNKEQTLIIKMGISLTAMILCLIAVIGLRRAEISFHVQCSNNSMITVWWDSHNKDYPFDEKHLKTNYVENTQILEILVPYDSISKIRIDIEQTDSEWKISDFCISYGFYKKEIPADDLYGLLGYMNDISKADIENESIKLENIGEDPYITINNLEILPTNLSKTTWIVSLICLVITIPIFIWLFIKANLALINREQFHNFNIEKLLLLCIDTMSLAVLFDRGILAILYKAISATDLLLVNYLEAIQNISLRRIIFWWIFLYTFSIILVLGLNKAFEYRYAIALGVFSLLVIGQFHGSSIGYLSDMLTEHTEGYQKTTLLGINQGLRGDDWGVSLPLNLAQRSNKEGFPYYNDNLMLDGCDVMVSAKLPVKDILAVFNPLTWGYYFLPEGSAVAFGWWLPFFLTFLSAIDLFYLISNNKKLSIVFGVLIVFAPCVQWWNEMRNLLYPGQYLLVIIYKFVKENNRVKKFIFSLLAILCAGTFLFIIYPAWEIPFAYVFGILAVWILIINKHSKPLKKENLFAYGLVFLLCIFAGMRFIHLSGDAMQIQLNTVYPGKVRAWRTVLPDIFLLKLINFTMGFGKYSTYQNNCEISQFFSAYFWTFLAWAICLKNKWNNANKKLIIILGSFDLILLYFMFGPRLDKLYNIILLSYSYPQRIMVVHGYCCVLISLLIINELLKQKEKWLNKIVLKKAIVIIGTVSILCISLTDNNIHKYVQDSLEIKLLVILFIFIWGWIGYAILTGRQIKLGLLMFGSLTILSTIFVNPIQQGLDDFEKSSLLCEIKELDKDNPGRWIISGNSTIANMVAGCGVQRLSGTYIYPDITMMEIIDTNHKYEESWNRYAHIETRLGEKNEFISDGAGLRITLDANTAKKLNVQYWVANEEVPENFYSDIKLKKIYQSAEWMIYKLNYIN